MFLTDRKLERRISEIEQYRYRDIIGLKDFAAEESASLIWAIPEEEIIPASNL